MESVKKDYQRSWNDVMYYFYVDEDVSAKPKAKTKPKIQPKTQPKAKTKPKGVFGRLQTAGRSLVNLLGKGAKSIRFVITKAWLIARVPFLVPIGVAAVLRARKKGKKVQTKQEVIDTLKKDKEFLGKIHSEVRKSKLEAVSQKKGVGEIIEEEVGFPLAPIVIAAIISSLASLIMKVLDMIQQKKTIPQALQELPQTQEYKDFIKELNVDETKVGGGELASEEITPAQGLKEWLKEYWYIPAGGGAIIILTTFLLTRRK